jgi:hypothetical protein
MRVPYPPNPPSSQPAGPRTDAELKQAWLDEIEDSSRRNLERSLGCAHLAEELDEYRVMAISDSRFLQRWYYWNCYILEHDLWVPIEQACDQSVLLPLEQRHIRLLHCPEKQRNELCVFFVNCQLHVQHHLALRYYLLVRAARHEATGKADWSPETAPPRSVYRDNTFFRPQVLRFRDYAR